MGESCDNIRKKINMFLATKEMTQAEFLKQIGDVNSNSFRRFMELKGPHSGCNNGTYLGALEFFQNREAEQKAIKAAAKVNRKRKRNEPDENTPSPHPLANDEIVSQILDVELEDENVYDNCDEVRRKLSVLIQSPGMTQTRVCNKLIECNSNALNKFLSKKGWNQGAGSDVYENAYLFFEKVRIFNKEPKSKHRVKSEAENPAGYDLVNAPPTRKLIRVLMPVPGGRP